MTRTGYKSREAKTMLLVDPLKQQTAGTRNLGCITTLDRNYKYFEFPL